MKTDEDWHVIYAGLKLLGRRVGSRQDISSAECKVLFKFAFICSTHKNKDIRI